MFDGSPEQSSLMKSLTDLVNVREDWLRGSRKSCLHVNRTIQSERMAGSYKMMFPVSYLVYSFVCLLITTGPIRLIGVLAIHANNVIYIKSL